jgi:cytoskeletal protein RodZ
MRKTRVLLSAIMGMGALLIVQSLYGQDGVTEPDKAERHWTESYDGPGSDDRTPYKDAKTPTGSVNDTDSNEEDRSIIFPEVWCADIVGDQETAKECWKAYRAGLSYYEWGLNHRMRVLWWQHVTTRAIFFVVLLLVGVGVYFSWVQFKAAPPSESSHELEVSLEGIKVSSPVLGVIILTLSLAFFYLYLTFVYPVQEVV